MLNNKKYFLIFMFLILLLCGMTMVSATDNSNTTITDTDTGTGTDVVTTDNSNIIEEKDNTINYEKNEVNSIPTEKSVTKQSTDNKNTKEATSINVNSYAELVQTVNNTLYFGQDFQYTINLLPGNYNATADMSWGYSTPPRTLIINGNGLVLDGGNSHRFMYVQNGTLEVNNITFTNYNYETGAVITNDDNGKVTVKDSKFINNAAEQASAIMNLGNCTVINCTFTGNSATETGAIVNNKGVLNVINSTFDNNNAVILAGAIIIDDGTVTVNGSNFTSNSAKEGGAIYIQNKATVIISDSNFKDNHVTNFGGAIYINDESDVTINDSSFTDNHVTNYDGGAIYNVDGTLTVMSSNFINNTANQYAGAIWNSNGSVKVYESYFTSNTAKVGGALVNYEGNVEINATFINNIASEQGGAILFNTNTNNVVNHSTFKNNSATHGGAIFNNQNAETKIINSTFTDNNVIEKGGAIFNDGTLNVSYSNFTNNIHPIYNGYNGIYKISNSQFIGNTPYNFILSPYDHNYYDILLNTDGSIIPVASTIKVYDGNTLKYTGRIDDDGYLNCRIPVSMHVRLVITGDDSESFKNNTYYVSSIIAGDYATLVTAVEAAKSSTMDSAIYVVRGNYNATQSMTWGSASGSRKLTIYGMGNTLDGKGKYRFMSVEAGHTLELQDITQCCQLNF